MSLPLIPIGYPIPPESAIWGPITIGVIFSVFGMGILLTISYLDMSSSDSRPLRAVILMVLGLNLGQTISDCSRMMKLNVYHAGDLIYLIDVRSRPEELISPIFSLIICTTAQVFLLRRCIIFARLATYSLAEKDSWTQRVRVGWRVLLFLGVILSSVFGIITIVALGRLHSLIEANRDTHPGSLLSHIGTAWLASTSAIDIALSGTLLWELRYANNNQETSYKGKRAIRAIIRVGWSNGVLVSMLQLLSLIFLLKGSSSWSDFPQIFISKIYSITLLTSITSPLSALRSSSGPSTSPPPAGVGARRTPPSRAYPSPALTTPLPMLFKHKNPSAEWSPSTLGNEVALQPYPLRNAECDSAQYARRGGRARLGSMTEEWELDSGMSDGLPITPIKAQGKEKDREKEDRVKLERHVRLPDPTRSRPKLSAIDSESSLEVKMGMGETKTFGSVGGV